MQNEQIRRGNTYGKLGSLFQGVSQAPSQEGGAPSTPQFGGFLLFMPSCLRSSSDAERPRSAK